MNRQGGSRSSTRWLVLVLGTWAAIGVPATATNLQATLTVDDDFSLYVSTDDSQAGTYVGSGTAVVPPPIWSWQRSYSFSAALTPGVTNYIHVKGWDLHTLIAAFLGEFTLSDASFKFGNGTQRLVTETSLWKVSSAGFGVGYYTPDALGGNVATTDPWWTLVPGIGTDATWIWSTDGIYTDSPRYFMVPIYPASLKLTVSTTPGGSVTTPGLGVFTYDWTTVVSAAAVPGAGYHFTGWTGTAVTAGKVADPSSASTSVTVDQDLTLQANFALDVVTLTTSSTEGGTVDTPGLGVFAYGYGTVVPVVATPTPHYHFVNWTGSAVAAGKVADPTSATTNVTMNGSYTLQANFACDQVTLLVTTTKGGTASSPGIGTFTYDYGTVVSLVAVVEPGYVWASWSGSLTSSSITDSIEMTAPMEVRANFTSLRDVLCVDDNGPSDPGPGPCNSAISDPIENGSPEHPFDTIQEAIDVAGPGARIVVREGVYCEQIDFLDKTITVTGLDPNGPQGGSYPIIDGSGVGPVVRIAACCPADCADSSGVSCVDAGAQPVLSGFVITGGKGYYASAIAVRNRSPLISNCVIVGNRSNLAQSGAVYFENSALSLVNCTITENVAGNQGAGIFGVNSKPVIVNSIVWANVPAQMAFDGASQPAVSYLDVQGGWAGTGNIDTDPLFALAGYWASPVDLTQAIDPLLTFAVWIPGDYHLMSKAGRWISGQQAWVSDPMSSPCIDAGDPQSSVLDEPAPNGNQVNLGAYGGTTQASKSGN
jgi:uncharacterized repeat protein (TIGR02543 family)